MKTLKKTLCLVLALVMLFGLCAVSSNAWLEYTDADKITYAEAVDTMSGIGVLEGYDTGDFQPTKNVTREEAAKMVAYLMIGNAKQADALKAANDPFGDVNKDRWSAGYIDYCVQLGILNGVGDGNFRPTAEVTGLEYAKMLLCAIGYGKNSEYVGANWAINVAKDALNYGMFKNNLDGATNVPATREECALYSFNTLGLSKVTYSALLGGYIENISSIISVDNAESNKEATLQDDFDLEKVPVDNSAFYLMGGHYWTVKDKKVTNSYGDKDDLKAAYTTRVTGNELYTLLGSDTVSKVNKDKLELNVYADGMEVDADDYFAEKVVKSNTKQLEGTGYGIQTYVYVTKTEVRICIINTYLAKVTKVTAESSTKDAETKADIAMPESFDVFGDTLTYEQGAKIIFNNDKFAKKDYVLVTVSYRDDADKPDYMGQGIVACPTVTSTIKAFTNTSNTAKVTASGTTYTQADNDFVFDAMTAASDMSKEFVNGTKYTLYIDEYGYIIGVDTTVAVNKFVYVAQFGQKLNTSSSLNDVNHLTADVYYTDGEHETVYVDTKDEEYDYINTYYSDRNDGILGDGAHNFFADGWDDYYYDVKEGLVEELNDDFTGLYIMKTSDKDEAILVPVQYAAEYLNAVKEEFVADAYGVPYMGPWAEYIVSTPIYKGVSALRGAWLDGEGFERPNVYADSTTSFFYVAGDYGTKSFKVNVYTGIANAPTTDGDNQGMISYYAEKSGTKYFADAALVVGDFAAYDSTVYFYNGKSTKTDLEDKSVDVNFQLYLDGKKDEKGLTFNFTTYNKANTAINKADAYIEDGGVYKFWAIEGSTTLVNPLDVETWRDEEYYVDTLYDDTYYTPYCVISEITKGTMYSEYANVYDANNHYNGYPITDDTVFVNVSDADYMGKVKCDDIDEFMDWDFDNDPLLVAFSYDKKTFNVKTVYVIGYAE